jgi:hypothetical protein
MSNTYQFKTTNIKGKQYVEVNQRVIAFRTLSEFKGYGLTTDVLHLDADSCVVQATITNADGAVVAQGMAQEDKSSSRINQTSSWVLVSKHLSQQQMKLTWLSRSKTHLLHQRRATTKSMQTLLPISRTGRISPSVQLD